MKTTLRALRRNFIKSSAWLTYIAIFVLLAVFIMDCHRTSMAQCAVEGIFKEGYITFDSSQKLFIGDVTVDVPPGQQVWIKPVENAARSSSAQGVPVKSITLIGKDAWQMSGTHAFPSSPPLTMLLIELSENPKAVSIDSWCHAKLGHQNLSGKDYSRRQAAWESNGFRMLGPPDSWESGNIRLPDRQTKFFGSPLVFDTDNTAKEIDRTYFFTMAFTQSTLIYIRFIESDIRNIGPTTMFENIQRNLMPWLKDTKNFAEVLFHQINDVCPY